MVLQFISKDRFNSGNYQIKVKEPQSWIQPHYFHEWLKCDFIHNLIIKKTQRWSKSFNCHHPSPQSSITTIIYHHNHLSPQSSITTIIYHHNHLSPQSSITTIIYHHNHLSPNTFYIRYF
ncbi:hypothetical protein ACTA71_002146 [Dictyostelium dimigraforme]